MAIGKTNNGVCCWPQQWATVLPETGNRIRPAPLPHARPQTQTAGNSLTAPFVMGPWGCVLGNIAAGYYYIESDNKNISLPSTSPPPTSCGWIAPESGRPCLAEYHDLEVWDGEEKCYSPFKLSVNDSGWSRTEWVISNLFTVGTIMLSMTPPKRW